MKKIWCRKSRVRLPLSYWHNILLKLSFAVTFPYLHDFCTHFFTVPFSIQKVSFFCCELEPLDSVLLQWFSPDTFNASAPCQNHANYFCQGNNRPCYLLENLPCLTGWASGSGRGGTTNNYHPLLPKINQTNASPCFMFAIFRSRRNPNKKTKYHDWSWQWGFRYSCHLHRRGISEGNLLPP